MTDWSRHAVDSILFVTVVHDHGVEGRAFDVGAESLRVGDLSSDRLRPPFLTGHFGCNWVCEAEGQEPALISFLACVAGLFDSCALQVSRAVLACITVDGIHTCSSQGYLRHASIHVTDIRSAVFVYLTEISRYLVRLHLWLWLFNALCIGKHEGINDLSWVSVWLYHLLAHLARGTFLNYD